MGEVIQFIPRTEHLVRESAQSYRDAIERLNNATYREIYRLDQFSDDVQLPSDTEPPNEPA